jgi:hypothetical protein
MYQQTEHLPRVLNMFCLFMFDHVRRLWYYIR